MHLILDTETTGLPLDWKAPVSNLRNWPRVVQIAWVFARGPEDHDGKNVHIIKPSGFIIPPGSSRIHGITTERAIAEGVDLSVVLPLIQADIARAETVVCHNVSFDSKVLGAEFLRAGSANPFVDKRLLCTMESSTNLCRIPGPYGFKWPNLQELHQHLFQATFEGAHDAAEDCWACMRCFFHLKWLCLTGAACRFRGCLTERGRKAFVRQSHLKSAGVM